MSEGEWVVLNVCIYHNSINKINFLHNFLKCTHHKTLNRYSESERLKWYLLFVTCPKFYAGDAANNPEFHGSWWRRILLPTPHQRQPPNQIEICVLAPSWDSGTWDPSSQTARFNVNHQHSDILLANIAYKHLILSEGSLQKEGLIGLI